MAAVYRYGAPPSMDALDSLLWREEQEELLAKHTNSMVWALTNKTFGKKIFPSFDEVIKPKPKDNRTAEEIVNDVADKIRHRIQKRGDKT